MREPALRRYRTVVSLMGPLAFVERVEGIRLEEVVHLRLPGGEVRTGQVILTEKGRAVIQVLESSLGLHRGVEVDFTGHQIRIPLSPEILGRRFDGAGRPRDGLPPLLPHRWSGILGAPINPTRRLRPHDFIQTGISTIDGLNTLVRGQKLPIFSAPGLPAKELAAQILRQAQVTREGERLAVVFGAIGIPFQEADYFERVFEEETPLERTVVFLNLADDPPLERLLTPRVALTVGEYLAFELGYQVLVLLTDITAYCEALREVAAAREEIPGRRGYPGYMYTDLATLYERAGRIKGRPGSLTLIPMLTMPDDDITHPVPDLTGYITEGQIVLSRELHRKGIFPPIDVLPSLSRLMDQGIGAGKTREDHRPLSHQLYAYYARGVELRRVAAIVGEEGLPELDQKYLHFARMFEEAYVHQGTQARGIQETLDLGWQLLALLPRDQITRIPSDLVDRYGKGRWTA